MAFSPFKFLQEVRSEAGKVTWPTRREVTITTMMVFVMVALASVFFFFADLIIRYFVTFLLGIADERRNSTHGQALVYRSRLFNFEEGRRSTRAGQAAGSRIC